MKIAMLGGTFNPFHIGHAMLAESVLNELGYDKIIFVPTGIPPHKKIAKQITPQHRLGMVQAFCDSVPGNVFLCDPCEVEREGISYTIDTVKYLYEKYDSQIEGQLALIMGEEVAAEFGKWKFTEQIASLCDFIIVPRVQSFLSGQEKFKNQAVNSYKGDFNVTFDKEKFGWPCTVLPEGVVSLSSTEIRTRIANKKSWRYLVPKPVFDYIESKGLYRDN